jgi:hypothetical protein
MAVVNIFTRSIFDSYNAFFGRHDYAKFWDRRADGFPAWVTLAERYWVTLGERPSARLPSG